MLAVAKENVAEVPNVGAVVGALALKVLQSEVDKRPRLVADAVGILKVCVEVLDEIAKSVPEVPTANV